MALAIDGQLTRGICSTLRTTLLLRYLNWIWRIDARIKELEHVLGGMIEKLDGFLEEKNQRNNG